MSLLAPLSPGGEGLGVRGNRIDFGRVPLTPNPSHGGEGDKQGCHRFAGSTSHSGTFATRHAASISRQDWAVVGFAMIRATAFGGRIGTTGSVGASPSQVGNSARNSSSNPSRSRSIAGSTPRRGSARRSMTAR